MEKIRKVNMFISLVLVILLVIIGVNIFRVGQRIDQKTEDIEILKQRVGSFSGEAVSLKTQIDFNQIQIADLWLATLKKENFDKINKWKTDNMNFLQCDKAFRDLYLQRAFFAYNSSPAKVLVYEFEKGYLIYENIGDVYCHLNPIDDNNPPKINCNELCIDEEE